MADTKVGTDAPPASVPVPLPANTAEVDAGSRIRDELIKDHNIDNNNDSSEKISEKNSKPSSSSASDSDDLAVALTKSNVPVRDEDEEKNREAALQRLPPHERDILKQQLEVPESKINYISLYRYATAKDLLILFVSSLAAIVSGALLPLMTIIFGTLAGLFRDKAIGTIGQAEFNHRLSSFTLYFVYLLIGMFFFTYVMTMGFLYLGESLTDKIREHYLKSLLRQNIAFYDKLGPGAITFSLTGQMALIQKGLSEKVGLTLSAAATFVTAFIIGFIRSAKLTGILVSIIVALTLDMGIGAKFMVKYAKKSIEAGVYGGSVAEEVLSAVRDTTAFSTQDRLSKHYDSYLVEAQKWGYKKAFAEALFIAGMFFVVNSNYALSFWEGSRLIVAGEATLSAVLTVLLSVMIGSFSLGNVAPNLGTIFGAVSAAAPIYACIDRISPINSESEEGEKIESVQGNIEFRNIKHIYPSRPEVVVMPDFSAVCPAGKTTALVGLSGSGKSTVIGLLERFYRPVGGEVLLDGVNIEKLNIKWLRQQISLVSQEPVLFAQTIIDNVANGLVGTEWEHASEEKKRSLVEDACKLANAHDFILSLPEGYDTNVGDKGYLMSGGQRQRIAIARAVISQPKILLLDEATSALDTSAEAQVQLALDRAAHGRTTITIAHRLSTIKNADNIIVMAAGQIIEQGTHTELLQKRGNYFNLVQAQSLNAQNDDESDSSSSSKAGEPVEEADKNIREELQRTRTSKSVRSMKSIQKDKVEHYNLWQLFKFIVGFNRPELGISIVGFIISVFHGLITPAQSVLFSKCITAMSVPPSQYPQMRKEINLFAGLFFMLACLHSFSYGSTSAIFGVTSERLTRRARLETFRRFLRQDIGWFDREENSAGSLVSYLSTETTHLAGISGTTLSTIIGAVATVVGAFILSISIAWKLGLVVSACLPILISCGYLRFAMLNKFNDRAENAYQEVGNYACEATSLIRTVLSLTREEEISRNYHLRILNERRRSIATIAWSAGLYAASQSLNFGIIALAFWYGGSLLGKGEYSTFQFFLAYSSIIFASQSVGAAFAFSPDISSARNAAKRMIVIFNRMSKMDWEAGDKIEKVEGSIEFRDVQFSFPTRPNQKILKGLNLSAKPGEYIALVGPSGCGKSTTIALAERFYEPSSGGIYVDGQNIADLNVNEYRSHLALVSQEPVLYHGSIKDNIVLGVNRDVTDDEINHACKQANIYDFIQSLPEGFGTVVGSKGSLLSGGQKQRICIARALIRNPRILLLDEATSALDSESEKVVQDALDVAAKGRTTIAIAHRLSTIQKADTIYVFENGRIVESGGHKELMEKRGKYFELVNLQSLSK